MCREVGNHKCPVCNIGVSVLKECDLSPGDICSDYIEYVERLQRVPVPYAYHNIHVQKIYMCGPCADRMRLQHLFARTDVVPMDTDAVVNYMISMLIQYNVRTLDSYMLYGYMTEDGRIHMISYNMTVSPQATTTSL